MQEIDALKEANRRLRPSPDVLLRRVLYGVGGLLLGGFVYRCIQATFLMAEREAQPKVMTCECVAHDSTYWMGFVGLYLLIGLGMAAVYGVCYGAWYGWRRLERSIQENVEEEYQTRVAALRLGFKDALQGKTFCESIWNHERFRKSDRNPDVESEYLHAYVRGWRAAERVVQRRGTWGVRP